MFSGESLQLIVVILKFKTLYILFFMHVSCYITQLTNFPNPSQMNFGKCNVRIYVYRQ